MHLWKIGLQEDESPGKATYSIAPIHSWKVELNCILEVVLVQLRCTPRYMHHVEGLVVK